MQYRHDLSMGYGQIPEWHKPTRQFIIRKIKEHIPDCNTLLELGVSGGAIVSGVEAESVSGLDFDAYELKIAKNKGTNATVHDLNYMLPYKEGSIDNILCIETLEHVADYRGLLEECHRTLRQQGKLIIAVPYYSKIKHLFARFAEPRHFMSEKHTHLFVPSLLIEEANNIGFSLCDYAEFGRVPHLRRLFMLVLVKA